MQPGTEPFGLIANGEIVIAEGKISAIGRWGEIRLGDDEHDTVIDCGGGVLTPGLIDCHTHLIFGGNRAAEFDERLSGRSYEELAGDGRGIQSTVNATRAASADDLFHAAERRLQALMSEGVTSVEIKSGYGLNLATERKMLEVAAALQSSNAITVHRSFLGAHALPGEYKDDPERYIDLVCEQMLPTLAAEGLVDSVDAFCETVGFSLDQTRRVFEAAAEIGLPVRLHAEQLSHSGGAALAARFHALSVDHLEYLQPEEAALLAASGTIAVLLPGAFYYLRETQLPPIEALRENGVGIAVATDNNPGSSPIASLLTVMNMGCVLMGLTPEEAVTGVTRHAASAIGLQETKGTLAIGKDADLVLWDIDDPAELCYRIGENRCRDVWVNGERR
ncbi:MAG: imidazolonepropionase [Pseudomonadota bacterium]